MHAIRQWSFQQEETFGAIARRYKHNLLNDVPPGTEIIHFCCDRYSRNSLKMAQQQHMYAGSGAPRVFQVSEQFQAPDPVNFFSVSANKAGLLNFLRETWSEDEQMEPSMGSTRLYLGGGFNEETKSVLITDGTVTDVADLESTHQEADTRVILHSVYSVQNEGVERVIIHANDTDVIITCVYYAATLLRDLPELWVRTARDSYLPIHEIAAVLDPAKSRALPFIHSLSGRDTTSYPFYTGKKAWFKSSSETEITALEDFGEQDARLTADVISQARSLMVAVYTNRGEDFDRSNLANVRVYKFLNNKSTLLKLLPPTEDAFLQHLKRAALAISPTI